jgi:hypothetical protein
MGVDAQAARRSGRCYSVAEGFNNEGSNMATVNFSVPEEIKEAFQEAFANENKSAVIARLMQRAVEEKKRDLTRAAAIDKLLELRRGQRPVSATEIARTRQADRP